MSGLIKPRLNCLATVIRVRSGAAGTGSLVRIEGKVKGAKYRDLLENLVQPAQDLRLG